MRELRRSYLSPLAELSTEFFVVRRKCFPRQIKAGKEQQELKIPSNQEYQKLNPCAEAPFYILLNRPFSCSPVDTRLQFKRNFLIQNQSPAFYSHTWQFIHHNNNHYLIGGQGCNLQNGD